MSNEKFLDFDIYLIKMMMLACRKQVNIGEKSKLFIYVPVISDI